MAKRVRDEDMQRLVELGETNPTILDKWEDGSRAKKTIEAYTRDWNLIKNWMKKVETNEVTEKAFFAAMEGLVGVYSKSRIEGYRSAMAHRQKLDLRADDAWTETRGFRIRFNALLKEADLKYRQGIASGKFKQTARGPIQEDKILDLVKFCLDKGEVEYAGGFIISFHALLRHADVKKLTGECLKHSQAGWKIKIVEGKGRPPGFVEWVDASECQATMAKLAVKTGKEELVFPNWQEGRANDLIQECALKNDWRYDGIPHAVWVHHGCRIGKATDCYEGGMDVRDLMERGRWDSERMALHYAVHGTGKSKNGH